MQENQTEYLTINEVQEMTGAHRNTVLYWIRTGAVNAVKNKFHFWQIPKAEVLALQQYRAERDALKKRNAKDI